MTTEAKSGKLRIGMLLCEIWQGPADGNWFEENVARVTLEIEQLIEDEQEGCATTLEQLIQPGRLIEVKDPQAFHVPTAKEVIVAGAKAIRARRIQ